MAAKKQKKEVQTEVSGYTVIKGCNVGCSPDNPNGTRYEVGDPYSPADHSEETTAALLDAEALEENDGDR